MVPSRLRTVVGQLTCLFVVVSVWMHSIVGWRSLRGALQERTVSAELMASLEAGWLFGGVFLLLFAALLFSYLRNPTVPGGARVVRWAALAVGLYGVAAMIRYGGNPFFLVFVVMGAGAWFSASQRVSDQPSGR